MTQNEVVLLVALLVATIPLVALARRAGISYPIVLVLGGLFLGFVPGLPSIHLDPNLVLLFFLPPLLYWEAVTAPTDIMLANAGQIGNLAIGLVFATTVVVAVVMHAVVPGLPWAVAFVLGAVVAPTDELASAPVLERLRMPRHLIAIVEGESLANDALSLVLYAAAVTAVVSGTFDLARDLAYVFVAAFGALVIGLAVGRAAVEGWRRIVDPQLQGVISLVVPFIAYIPAQRFGLSGVLAVITTGAYANRFTPVVLTAATRLQGRGFWDTFVFVANALLFLLVGLQLRGLAVTVFLLYSWQNVALYTIAINTVVVGVRFAWILLTEYLPFVGASSEHPDGDWKHAIVASWSGLRGAVSLAAALAIPLTVVNGSPFPHRDLIVFLTFTVILVTLVGGGLALPSVISVLKIADGGDEEREDLQRALLGASAAALARIAALERDGRIDLQHARALRRRYEHLRAVTGNGTAPEVIESERRHETAEHEVIQAQRDALIALRARGEIDNVVLRQVQRSLDLAESRIERSDR